MSYKSLQSFKKLLTKKTNQKCIVKKEKRNDFYGLYLKQIKHVNEMRSYINLYRRKKEIPLMKKVWTLFEKEICKLDISKTHDKNYSFLHYIYMLTGYERRLIDIINQLNVLKTPENVNNVIEMYGDNVYSLLLDEVDIVAIKK